MGDQRAGHAAVFVMRSSRSDCSKTAYLCVMRMVVLRVWVRSGCCYSRGFRGGTCSVSTRLVQAAGSRHPLSRHQERRADPRDRRGGDGLHREPTRSRGVPLSVSSRHRRGPLHQRRADAGSGLPKGEARRRERPRPATHLRQRRGRPWASRARRRRCSGFGGDGSTARRRAAGKGQWPWLPVCRSERKCRRYVPNRMPLAAGLAGASSAGGKLRPLPNQAIRVRIVAKNRGSDGAFIRNNYLSRAPAARGPHRVGAMGTELLEDRTWHRGAGDEYPTAPSDRSYWHRNFLNCPRASATA